MLVTLLMISNLTNAIPALQAPPADWSQDDPAQQEVITDYWIDQDKE